MDPETPATEPTPHMPQVAANNDMLLGIISYLGILVIIPLVISHKTEFVRFHAKQGLVLFLSEVILSALSYGFAVAPVIDVVNLLILVLIVIGIVHVAQHEEKELPVIGHIAQSFRF